MTCTCTDSINNSKLLCLLLFFIASQLIKLSLDYIVGWFYFCGFYFYDNAMIKL